MHESAVRHPDHRTFPRQRSVRAAGALVLAAACAGGPAIARSGTGSELVYAGTRLDTPDGAIFGARLDPETGALRPLGKAAAVDRPTWILPDPHRAVLYAVSETGNDGLAQGGVLSFAADRATGALTPVSECLRAAAARRS